MDRFYFGVCFSLGFIASIFSGHSQTVNFNYTGTIQTWTVPPCVFSINVTAAGAKGGGANGGNGATITGSIAVTPGQILEIRVGGMGACPGTGYNGGGNGPGANNVANAACGGGGATDLRTAPYALGNRVIVAGGGGGMGGGTEDGQGGLAGCPNGTVGAAPFGSGGGGATTTNGGSAGPPWIGSGNAGTAGSLGQGGNGGSDPCYNIAPGAGGGGGLYGGGGGGSDCFGSGAVGGGGGGGGSSLIPSGGGCTQGNNSTHGYLTITYTASSAVITASNTGPYCVGQTIQLNSTSGADSYSWTGPNGFISNLQNPTIPNATINAAGTYNLTSVSGGCTATATTTVVMNDPITPTFNQIGPLCHNSTPPSLPSNSTNSPSISGTWNSASISTNTVGTQTYTFTPNPSVCAIQTIMQIEIQANEAPTFGNFGPYCVNETPASLPLTSNNGFTGTWYPSMISTASSGDQNYTFTPSANQCATQSISQVSVLSNSTSNTNVEACGSYTWNGTAYFASGNYTFQTTNAIGCDSIATLDLVILSEISSQQDLTVCDEYTWNGQTYYTSGIYSFETISTNGCDSTAIIDLTVNLSGTSNTTISSCDNYFWNGQNYTTSGTYTYYTTNVAGCDSTAILNVTINQSNTSQNIVNTCDDYFWNGQNYTTSGTYTYYTTNMAGCDSTAVLELTVSQSVESNSSITACESYYWNNQIYTTSGNYEYHTTTQSGCDSIAKLNLTVNPSYNTNIVEVACDSYVGPNGTTYTTSGNYVFNFTTSNGCDSIIGVNLTVNYSDYIVENYSTCFPNDTVQTIIQSVNQYGCDSTHIYVPVMLPYHEKPMASFIASPNEIMIPDGYTEMINNSINSVGYTWSFGDNSSNSHEVSPSHIYEEPGVYTIMLIAEHQLGCTDTSYYAVVVNEEFYLFVPNSFTPDGDKFNESFIPHLSGSFDPYDYQLSIYNRWGEILFESNNHTVGWNGTYGGNVVKEGAYIWVIRVGRTGVDKPEIHRGHVNLLR